MSYIENNLLPGERVIVSGRTHILLILRPVVFTFFILALFLLGVVLVATASGGGQGILGVILTLVTGLMLLGAVPAVFGSVIAFFANECAVTDKRVIGKFGLLRRSTLEFPFHQIESIAFDQGLVDRIFGAATIRVRGSGTAWVSTPALSNFKQFRCAALEQMEALQQQPVHPQIESAAVSSLATGGR